MPTFHGEHSFRNCPQHEGAVVSASRDGSKPADHHVAAGMPCARATSIGEQHRAHDGRTPTEHDEAQVHVTAEAGERVLERDDARVIDGAVCVGVELEQQPPARACHSIEGDPPVGVGLRGERRVEERGGRPNRRNRLDPPRGNGLDGGANDAGLRVRRSRERGVEAPARDHARQDRPRTPPRGESHSASMPERPRRAHENGRTRHPPELPLAASGVGAVASGRTVLRRSQ